MKEKIYTIPVTDAFRVECECPLCEIERNLLGEYIDYFLGPSLMEPDSRINTNDKGFCREHFEMLYNKQENRLGLGLMIDTHLHEQNNRLNKVYDNTIKMLNKNADKPFIKNLMAKPFSRKSHIEDNPLDNLINELEILEGKCAICSKLEYTMDRYIDVILYLWFEEEDFKALFNSKKGFCLKHLKDILLGTKKYLNSKKAAIFTKNLLAMQSENMDRIQKEVNWFTKKFDYLNNDKPWGNSRDAIQRSIQKIVGPADLK